MAREKNHINPPRARHIAHSVSILTFVTHMRVILVAASSQSLRQHALLRQLFKFSNNRLIGDVYQWLVCSAQILQAGDPAATSHGSSSAAKPAGLSACSQCPALGNTCTSTLCPLHVAAVCACCSASIIVGLCLFGALLCIRTTT